MEGLVVLEVVVVDIVVQLGAGTSGQGNAGGAGRNSTSPYSGGGGGGATSSRPNCSYTDFEVANGGVGLASYLQLVHQYIMLVVVVLVPNLRLLALKVKVVMVAVVQGGSIARGVRYSSYRKHGWRWRWRWLP